MLRKEWDEQHDKGNEVAGAGIKDARPNRSIARQKKTAECHGRRIGKREAPKKVRKEMKNFMKIE